MAKKVLVKSSKIHGKGIFASESIKKGEAVFIITGRVVSWTVKDEKTSLYGPCWVGMSKHRWIDPDGLANFLNHSCDPSCGIKGRRIVTALRDIRQGEEITIDYSITEMDRFWHMKCYCKSKKCRRVIRSIQYLPKNVFKKYTPCVPTYFMRVYNKEHG